MRTKYDALIIGSGSGGLNIAMTLHAVGLNPLLIEKDIDNIGGDCLNTGCVPSKALIHISRLVASGRQAQQFGFQLTGSVDWSAVKSYIQEKKDQIKEHESLEYFQSLGMDVVIGEGFFVGKRQVQVEDTVYQGKNIVIATGSHPRHLDLPGMDMLEYGRQYFDSDSLWDLDNLPQRLTIIGGGPIGLEIGQALQRLGVQVSVVQRGNTFLPKEHPEISPILQKQLEAEGIDFYFNTEPIGVLSKDTLKVRNRATEEEFTLGFDGLMIAIGRELRGIKGLEQAKIQTDDRGRITVNRYLQTSNPHVYVAGDAVGSFQFTHAAELHAQVIVKNLLSPWKKSLSWNYFSWVTFTDPEIATFGRSEERLTQQNIHFETLEIDVVKEDRQLIEETPGKLRLYIGCKQILGGTMIGAQAGEISQELILALSAGLKVDELFNKIYPYPTASRINKAAIRQLYKRKLTSINKTLLGLSYRVFG